MRTVYVFRYYTAIHINACNKLVKNDKEKELTFRECGPTASKLIFVSLPRTIESKHEQIVCLSFNQLGKQQHIGWRIHTAA